MFLRRVPLTLGIIGAAVSACGDDDELTPALAVIDQTPAAVDVVTIESVTATEDGFVVIVQSVNDAASTPAIGVRAVTRGEQSNLTVALERPVVNNESLYARLHVDSDGDGNYEWVSGGSVDPIETVDGVNVQAEFSVTSTQPITPTVLADDQPLGESGGDNVLFVKSAVTSSAGFVLIQDQVTTSTLTVYGFASIAAGLNAVIEVALTETPTAGDALEAAIHVDVNQNGTFEPEIDTPLMVDGDRVRSGFMLLETQP